MEVALPVLIVTLFLGVFALLIVLGLRQQRRGRENLAKLADRLGLPVPAVPRGFWAGLKTTEIAGAYRGRAVRVYNYTTGSGKHRTTWCALGVTVQNPGKLTLRVSRENVLTRVGRAFGIADVATGDAAFDGQFHLKSNDPDYIRAAFIPEVRAQIAEVWKNSPRGTFNVEGNEIKYAEPGAFSSDKICERLPALVDLACLLADVVEARGG